MSLKHSIKLFFYKNIRSTTFIIEVRNSEIGHVHGINDKRFINDCKDIITKSSLLNGIIYGTRNDDGHIHLKTSSDVSKEVSQRLRNIWSFYS